MTGDILGNTLVFIKLYKNTFDILIFILSFKVMLCINKILVIHNKL